jgi:hypothetical protein
MTKAKNNIEEVQLDDPKPGHDLPQNYAPGANRRKGWYDEKKKKLYPVGAKGRGWFVGTTGDVVMNVCTRCGHTQSASDAVKGVCLKCHYDIRETLN